MARDIDFGRHLQRETGKRLSLLALLILLAGFGWTVLRPILFGSPIYDFHPYYLAAGATLAGEDPYDHAQLIAGGQELGLDKVPEYRYPPFFTLLLLPLAWIPFPVARVIWYLMNLVLLAGSVFLAFRTLRL